ncbi:bifunctional 2',3'-cyclic-nucleotide 2'-phosphodiesterase/3'-nucleotidase [Thorsellia anophelis]|uniref:2',3'-cyclic-nucleotide 2'-phosphodiesterase / 3'-nucleotidase n=1 Tax=Thorsellia anophelis DSM 18579 TaxID=1123402 RepID=A0A1I0BJX2_9GAMM|nr:bifunctional 2',3'-cyclic-nucleotide 2'-phosphodiesterase/3'-nucleotidase [Thorsellia anophelis]SET06566.1 2',3'-cyclic-nucleotide 2'-phosphodiesterase / 3'-nucleotidase [Thorsellia anophelis DSM 18579]
MLIKPVKFICFLIALGGCMTKLATADVIKLRVLATSDIHANMMDYDYYRLEPTEKFGLTRTASLIKQARLETENTVLIDNGDLIQGSPLGDYIASKGLTDEELHPVMLAMNSLDYTVATLGNHEFNYGLPFLNQVLKGANFPYVNANILDAQTNAPYFTPYTIIPTPVKTIKGDTVTLNIGYIGFIAPKITIWDKQHLDGKVVTEDIITSAKKWVPKMKAQGADLIIAINHSGIDASGYVNGMENAGFYLSEVPNIDAIITGHSHSVFPSSKFDGLPHVDINNGLINGTPTVMPGFWGDHLGVIDITLDNQNGNWSVVQAHAKSRPIFDATSKSALVEADIELINLLSTAHDATQHYVNQPIGKSKNNLYGYLALIQDSPTIQIVNQAQITYVQNVLDKDGSLEKLPILSAAAPFKAGGRDSYAVSYTEVDKGELTYRNAADLYLYPNTLTVVKITGEEVQQWLECSAGQFNQIDIENDNPQELINFNDFRSYNFDVIDGVSYEIDITQPARYDGDCNLINPDVSRIVNLTFEGKPIVKSDLFYVVTNNYRGFGGKFAGTGSDKVVIAAPDENRAILASYITEVSALEGQIDIQADNNWRLRPIVSDKTLDIRFGTAGHDKAHNYIKSGAKVNLISLKRDPEGIEIYRLDLQSKK